MNRAYSVLTIRAVDDDARVIEGIATTPETDRMGDVVEPSGAAFTLPLPFLWQHDKTAPIGHVTHANVTADGIAVRVQLASDNEPGPLKDLLDMAWRSIKKGLVRGLSIGFTPIESADIQGTWGQRFLRWDWHELSAVTIPANQEATILAVKQFDGVRQAASGRTAPASLPGASGLPVKVIRTPKPGAGTMNYTEQIKSFEATRAAKVAEREGIQKAAADAGQTKDAGQKEAFDTLTAEIKAIDAELVDLRAMETENAAAAAAVPATKSVQAGADARGAVPSVVVSAPAVAPGIRFARVAKCLGLAYKQHRFAGDIAAERYDNDPLTQKAVAIAAGSTATGNWAAKLVGAETDVYADFVQFLRPMTILGKFGAGGIPAIRNVPFRTALISQTNGGAGYWVGQGKAKPLTKFAFDRTTLEPLKVANIAVVTDELLRAANPAADGILRDQLAAALAGRLDTDFIDVTKVADPNVSPASITNGATPIPSSGNDADAVRADVQLLFAAFIAANNAPTNGVFIMSAVQALALSMMMNPLGQPEFPGLSMTGGTFFGLPVIVSEYCSSDSDGSYVTLVNASDIYLGDEGGIAVDVSDQASLEMDAEPAHNSTSPTPATLVSLWQTNSVAFRAERTINWKLRRADAVQVLSEVNWGAPA